MPNPIDNNDKPTQPSQDGTVSATAASPQISPQSIQDTPVEEETTVLLSIAERVAVANKLEEVKDQIEVNIIRKTQMQPPITTEEAESVFKIDEQLNKLLKLTQESINSLEKD